MTRTTLSWKLAPFALFVAGCAAAPSTQSFATSEEAAALRTLERTNASAINAVRSIDQARDVSLYNLKNAKMAAFKRCTAVLQEGGRVDVHYDFTQGAAETTGRQLDLMIEGPGFFVVKLPPKIGDGLGYVRHGSFFINDKGEFILNDAGGHKLDPPILVPANATSISIASDGRVSALIAGNTTPRDVGQIMLAHFLNPEGLIEMEPGIFQRTETSGAPTIGMPGEDDTGTLRQGSLEKSNVDITSETIRLQQLDQWREALLRALNIHR